MLEEMRGKTESQRDFVKGKLPQLSQYTLSSTTPWEKVQVALPLEVSVFLQIMASYLLPGIFFLKYLVIVTCAYKLSAF